MATQTALALVEIAKPLKKITIPIPDPKEYQLLIRNSFAGITPLDQKLRDYNVFNIGSNLPAVLAFGLVGVIVKTGPNTSRFSVGCKVFSQALFSIANNLSGGLQEYTLIDERFTALVPKNISEADAAVFPINAFTSATALFTTGGLNGGFGFPFPGTDESKTFDYKSITVVIIGGGTACGKFAVQFARIAGIGRIIVTASLETQTELRNYGATHVLDRKASDLSARIKALVGDDLVYLYDTFNRGDHTFGVSLLSSTKKGILLHLVPGQVDENISAEKKAGFEARQLNGASTLHPDLAVLFWKVLPEWIENGDVKVLQPYKIIDGLDAVKVNAALDGHRDGIFDRWNVRV